jgi:hypothetical protein
MQETPQQYTQRILGYSSGKDALRVQQATPGKLTTLTRRLGRKQLARRRPTSGLSPRFWRTWPMQSWSSAFACA